MLHPLDVVIPFFPLGEGQCASTMLVFLLKLMELIPLPSLPMFSTGISLLNF